LLRQGRETRAARQASRSGAEAARSGGRGGAAARWRAAPFRSARAFLIIKKTVL
jgi:hypothetical protein